MHKNKRQKSALLCDASFSAIPLLEALKAKGIFVAVCGSRSGDPCHALADASYNFDYSNAKKLLKIVKDNNFDYLVPGCTDVSYISCAWVAEKLALPGFDNVHAVQVINHKDQYRKLGKEKGYPIPAYETDPENFKALTFPVLLKPVSSFSGRGIVRFNRYAELKRFMERGDYEPLRGQALLEEFSQGQLYSHSAFLKAGKIVIDFFVNEYCTIYPYQVNSSCLSTTLTIQVQKQMQIWLEHFAKDLNLVDGLLHTQFIFDGTRVYLVESCRRCPGDLYSLLIQKSTGINYAALYVSPYIQLSYKVIAKGARKNYSRHTLSIDHDAIFLSAGMAASNSNVTYLPIKKIGELLRAAPIDRAGIFFIEHPNIRTMQEMTKDLYKVAKIETIPVKR